MKINIATLRDLARELQLNPEDLLDMGLVKNITIDIEHLEKMSTEKKRYGNHAKEYYPSLAKYTIELVIEKELDPQFYDE